MLCAFLGEALDCGQGCEWSQGGLLCGGDRSSWPAATGYIEAEDIARRSGQIPPLLHVVFYLRPGSGVWLGSSPES